MITPARRLKLSMVGLVPGVRAGDELVYFTHQAVGLGTKKGVNTQASLKYSESTRFIS
jgi:hypothetical protein